MLVNDEPITSLDIQERAKMMSIFSRGKEGEKEAIDQLIDEVLMIQEAKKRKKKRTTKMRPMLKVVMVVPDMTMMNK